MNTKKITVYDIARFKYKMGAVLGVDGLPFHVSVPKYTCTKCILKLVVFVIIQTLECVLRLLPSTSDSYQFSLNGITTNYIP